MEYNNVTMLDDLPDLDEFEKQNNIMNTQESIIPSNMYNKYKGILRTSHQTPNEAGMNTAKYVGNYTPLPSHLQQAHLYYAQQQQQQFQPQPQQFQPPPQQQQYVQQQYQQPPQPKPVITETYSEVVKDKEDKNVEFANVLKGCLIVIIILLVIFIILLLYFLKVINDAMSIKM